MSAGVCNKNINVKYTYLGMSYLNYNNKTCAFAFVGLVQKQESKMEKTEKRRRIK